MPPAPHWERMAAALTRGFAMVRSPQEAESRAVPNLLACRLTGSVLWRAGRWRRGQARLSEVTDRLSRLDEDWQWLTEERDQLMTALNLR